MSSFKVFDFKPTSYDRLKELALEQQKLREGRCPFKDGASITFVSNEGDFTFGEAVWKNSRNGKTGVIPAVLVTDGKSNFFASLSLFLSVEMPEDNELVQGLFSALKDTRNYDELLPFFSKKENVTTKLTCVKKLDTSKDYESKIIVFRKEENN